MDVTCGPTRKTGKKASLTVVLTKTKVSTIKTMKHERMILGEVYDNLKSQWEMCEIIYGTTMKEK